MVLRGDADENPGRWLYRLAAVHLLGVSVLKIIEALKYGEPGLAISR